MSLSTKVRVGAPLVVDEALTLVPLLACPPGAGAAGGGPAGLAYLPGPVAFGSGAVAVVERTGGASVPVLQLTNGAKEAVLLIAGEQILGNLQNRILNVSLLVAAGSATEVPVSCVEAGRWREGGSARRSEHAAPPSVRGAAYRSVGSSVRAGRGKVSDQGAVWDAVDSALSGVSAAAPERALESAYEVVAGTGPAGSRRWRRDGRDGRDGRAAELVPVEGQVGVVAVVRGIPVALDLFDRPGTLASYWDSLVAGYSLDARVGSGPRSPSRSRPESASTRRWTRVGSADGTSRGPSDGSRGGSPETADPMALDVVREVERFLARVAEAQARAVEARPVGLGRELHLEGPGLAGCSILWDDEPVHLGVVAV